MGFFIFGAFTSFDISKVQKRGNFLAFQTTSFFMRTKTYESVVLKSGLPQCPFYVKFDFSPDKKKFKQKYLKSELEAQAFADEKNAELNLPKELKFENTDRIVFSQIKDLCALNKVTLTEAYNFLTLKIGEIQPIKEIAISEALPAITKGVDSLQTLCAFIHNVFRHFLKPIISKTFQMSQVAICRKPLQKSQVPCALNALLILFLTGVSIWIMQQVTR